MCQVDAAIYGLAALCRDARPEEDPGATNHRRAVIAYHMAADSRLGWDAIGAALGIAASAARKLARGLARSQHFPDPGQSPAEFNAWRRREKAHA